MNTNCYVRTSMTDLSGTAVRFCCTQACGWEDLNPIIEYAKDKDGSLRLIETFCPDCHATAKPKKLH